MFPFYLPYNLLQSQESITLSLLSLMYKTASPIMRRESPTKDDKMHIGATSSKLSQITDLLSLRKH